MFRTAALILAAGVVSAPAAFADSRGVARGRLEQVQAMAHRVEDEAQQVRAGARTTHHYRLLPREIRAMRRLDVLVFRAREFHREAEGPRVRNGRLDDAWGELQLAWRQAAESFPGLRTGPYVRRDFRQLTFAMDRLTDSYERFDRADRGDPRRRGDGRGPYVGRR